MARVGEMVFAGGNRKLLLLALGAGLIAAILVFVAVQSSGSDNKSASTSGPVTSAVVASKAIAAGTTITAGDLKVVEVPNSLLVTGAYTETSSAVGQVTRVAINPGEQITGDKLGSALKSEGLNSVVPKGKRAIGLKVEQVTAAGGLLLPGDRVDVLAVFGESNNFAGPNTVVTVLQNIEILSVAQEAQKPLASPAAAAGAGTSTSGQVPSDAKTKPDAGTVTLAVDPQQAELLAGVQEKADKVYLTLRGYGDQDVNPVPTFDISSVSGGAR